MREARRRLHALSTAKDPEGNAHRLDVKDILVEVHPDAARRILRAQIRYWQGMYELERERLVKMWLLFEDAQREADDLRQRLGETREYGEAASVLRAAREPSGEPSAVADRVDEGAARVDDDGMFHYGPYSLYRIPVATGGGGEGTFYFFARDEPKRGEPSALPEDCTIGLNPINGLPFLKKKESDAPGG